MDLSLSREPCSGLPGEQQDVSYCIQGKVECSVCRRDERMLGDQDVVFVSIARASRVAGAMAVAFLMLAVLPLQNGPASVSTAPWELPIRTRRYTGYWG